MMLSHQQHLVHMQQQASMQVLANSMRQQYLIDCLQQDDLKRCALILQNHGNVVPAPSIFPTPLSPGHELLLPKPQQQQAISMMMFQRP